MTALRLDSFRHEDPEGVAAFRTLERDAPNGPSRPPTADAHLLVARRGDTPVARLSYRVAQDMYGAPEVTGVVGHYQADEGEAGAALLRHAVSLLAELGAELVVGPMDSTTWDRYRLALPTPEAGDPAPFLTEPVNPPDYPAHFEATGFEPITHYVSRVIEDLDTLADRTRAVVKQLTGAGYRIEPMNPDRFGGTMDGLYDLSLRAFATNPFFTPIKRDEFQALYQPVRSFLDPELVLLARDAEDAVMGFVFGLPDLLHAAGEPPTRVVVKTVAVDDAARGAGIGSLLVHELHRRAADRGYRSAIHALIQVDNHSLRISEHGGALFRRYALFGRKP
jgi:GNAT superfamily N-acetyltransferase